MDQFELLQGDLYVGQQAAETDYVNGESGDHLYGDAVFQSDTLSLIFKSGVGLFFAVRDEHFTPLDEETTVYYPSYNEAVVQPKLGQATEDRELLAEDVCLQYAVLDGSMYIRSQSEITAYGGALFLAAGDIYSVEDSMLIDYQESAESDDFLGIEETAESVTVRNIRTGFTSPVSQSKVSDVLESDEPNGVLEVEEPQSIVEELTGHL